LKEPILIEIAEKLNKSPAQVALRWGIQSGHSVLPKSVNESRIKENLMLFDWFIPPELFSKLSGIFQVHIYIYRASKNCTCMCLWAYNHIHILSYILDSYFCVMQQRLLRGDMAIHETLSLYKRLQELWDGEI
jgi:alcohol dehydrogenase (NADP+)